MTLKVGLVYLIIKYTLSKCINLKQQFLIELDMHVLQI